MMCSLDKMPFRKLRYIDFNQVSDEEIAKLGNLTNVCINFFKEPKYIDIGSFCFRERHKRSNVTSSEEYHLRIVSKSSLDTNRAYYIKRFIRHLYFLFSMSLAEKVLLIKIQKFRYFIRLCDSDSESFKNDDAVFNFYEEYVAGLTHKVRCGIFSVHTASTYQQPVREALLSMLGDDVRKRILAHKRFYRPHKSIQPTEAPSRKNVRIASEVFGQFFEDSSKFLIHGADFPFVLNLPHENYGCFPSRNITFGSTVKAWDPSKYNIRNAAPFDFREMRILTIEEFAERSRFAGHFSERRNSKNCIRVAKKVLSAANSDKYHKSRIFLGNISIRTFAYCFISITGMNPQQVSQLEWNEGFRKAKLRTKFKTIKARANGKEVQFKVETKFLIQFKKYLKLRDFMTNAIEGEPPNRLFFTIINNSYSKLQPKFFTPLQRYYEDHLGLTVKVSPKMWRVWVNQNKIKKLETSEAAQAMQHSEGVNAKYYMWGNREDSSSELSDFLEKYYQSLVVEKDVPQISIPTGQCRNFGEPNSIGLESEFKPDCIQSEGCFTCEHYAVSANSQDLRKLLSYKYVLLATKRLANSEQEFERLFRFILSSIDKISQLVLDTRKVSVSELETIKKDIFIDQKLDSVWQRKLDLLIDLDVL